MSDAAHALWSQLRAHLEQRYQALFDEVRRYPTPIAHCDDQLPKLIEQRSHALAQLQRMGEASAASPEAMRAYVATAPWTDDDTEEELLAQLRTVLGITVTARLARPRVARLYTDTRNQP